MPITKRGEEIVRGVIQMDQDKLDKFLSGLSDINRGVLDRLIEKALEEGLVDKWIKESM